MLVSLSFSSSAWLRLLVRNRRKGRTANVFQVSGCRQIGLLSTRRRCVIMNACGLQEAY